MHRKPANGLILSKRTRHFEKPKLSSKQYLKRGKGRNEKTRQLLLRSVSEQVAFPELDELSFQLMLELETHIGKADGQPL